MHRCSLLSPSPLKPPNLGGVEPAPVDRPAFVSIAGGGRFAIAKEQPRTAFVSIAGGGRFAIAKEQPRTVDEQLGKVVVLRLHFFKASLPPCSFCEFLLLLKKLSEVNKKNRAKQQLISTTGPKSIAKRQHDYVEIDNILASQTNDGSDNNANVNHECDHVSNERSNEENDVFHSLNGRSSAGSCVFPSHNACYLLGFAYNRVAEGKILNKDPSKIVDGIPLGEDYYEVQVTNELMRRGHSYATVDDLVSSSKLIYQMLMKKKLLKSGDEEDVVEEWR
ncbi:hypothetical protein Taro_026427 [Colocasia esculenta]|uniref:Transposase Tnp1/En/Spm-like domain-containing protein n=1 Tax=Colocasia esculenta TaxID=4460 RepID=A0A843VCW0_COLES|nr:hypothetical protein [Colocasia esculenta]